MYYNSKISGQLIRKLRIERDLSQEMLSGLAGISRSHLAMIESGRRNITVETLWRITSAMGLHLSTFIRLLEEHTPPHP